MQKEEVVAFMLNSISMDNEANMRAMGADDATIAQWTEHNKSGMEYLLANLYDKLVAAEIIK